MTITPFDMYRFESFGWLDSKEDHAKKVEAVHDGLANYPACRKSFMLEEYLHYNNLDYNTLTSDELNYILGKGDTD